MASEIRRILSDFSTALLAWRVWYYLGARDVRIRFRRSVVGPLWIFIHLGLMVAGIGFIYGHLLNQDIHAFLPFLTAGLVTWGFLSASLVEGSATFVQAEPYIKHFTLPKQVYVLRTVVAQLLTFLIGIGNVLLVMLFTRTPIGLGTLYFLPGLLLLIAIITAHVWIMAYLSVRIRDLVYAMGGLLSVVFYVTPIIFTVDQLRARHLEFVYQYNPFYYFIELVRYPLLNGAPASAAIYGVSFAYLAVGWLVAILVSARLDRDVPYLL